MTRLITGLGQAIQPDEAFDAWTSGDLDRMLIALPARTNLVERHFLLMSIVSLTYKRRAEPGTRQVCGEVGLMHLRECDAIAPALERGMGGFLPCVPTFANLARLFAEDGDYPMAIAICERAQAIGVRDGTKGGFAGRIARLRRRWSTSKAGDA